MQSNVAPQSHRTIDDEYSDIATQAPGFGGLFYDSTSGAMKVYLTNPSLRAAVNAPIAAFVARHKFPTPNGIQILQGQYDYRDLVRWYRQMKLVSSIFAAGSGITSTDIDEARNRIVIGVVDDAARQRILAALAEVPNLASGAVIVEQSAPAEVFSTLQDYQDPDRGGEEIGYGSGIESEFCTNGFNAYAVVNGAVDSTSGHRYFITASHCTNLFGGVTGMTMGQPNSSIPKGTEVQDPPMFTSSQSGACPVGRRCRYSDAAVFEYIGYISWKWPYILKVCSGITICGETEMQAEATSTAVGLNVQKMGMASGWTSGNVIATCVDVPQFGNDFDTGRTMLCQEKASYASQAGDSGGPVYRSDGIYRSAGIEWGGDKSGSYFSPLAGLQADGLSYTTARQSSLAP